VTGIIFGHQSGSFQHAVKRFVLLWVPADGEFDRGLVLSKNQLAEI
jgi:hypothetical protein